MAMYRGHGLVRLALALGAVCAVMAGSSVQAEAQRSPAVRARVFDPNIASGSRIGLSIEDVADNDAADEGAVVLDVRSESPAASAGFAEGDILVEFDGERVRSATQLTRLVRETPAGRTVEATVLRDGNRVGLEVTPEPGSAVIAAVPSLDSVGRGPRRLEPGALQDFVEEYRRSAPNGGRDFTFEYGLRPGQVRLGVNVQELSPQLADYFGVDEGVLVSGVDDDSVGAEAGLQAGDVITSVDGRVVEDIATLRRRLSAVGPGEEMSIGVTRGGRELELAATTSEGPARRRGRIGRFRNGGPAI